MTKRSRGKRRMTHQRQIQAKALAEAETERQDKMRELRRIHRVNQVHASVSYWMGRMRRGLS